MAHCEAITKWQEIATADRTLVVDVAEVELQASVYRQRVDELLEVAPVPENRDEIASRIAAVWAAAQSIRMVCDGLEGPLDRLVGHLCDEDDDGDKNHG
jgi:hypothetical protein